MNKIYCFFIAFIFIAPISLNAQNLKDQGLSPKTKLEEFSARKGTVIVGGLEKIGVVSGRYGTSIKVEAKEFLNVSTGKKEYGITIDVRKREISYTEESTSYIDYDEIESLISGIDYISKVDKTSTRFQNFQADYNTKGDFRISTFSSEEKIMVLVSSGTNGSVKAYFNFSSLSEIRSLIAKAKAKITP